MERNGETGRKREARRKVERDARESREKLKGLIEERKSRRRTERTDKKGRRISRKRLSRRLGVAGEEWSGKARRVTEGVRGDRAKEEEKEEGGGVGGGGGGSEVAEVLVGEVGE